MLKKSVAFTECILLAHGTQGGIPYEQALNLTTSERRAAIEILNKVYEDAENKGKKKPKGPQLKR